MESNVRVKMKENILYKKNNKFKYLGKRKQCYVLVKKIIIKGGQYDYSMMIEGKCQVGEIVGVQNDLFFKRWKYILVKK